MHVSNSKKLLKEKVIRHFLREMLINKLNNLIALILYLLSSRVFRRKIVNNTSFLKISFVESMDKQAKKSIKITKLL